MSDSIARLELELATARLELDLAGAKDSGNAELKRALSHQLREARRAYRETFGPRATGAGDVIATPSSAVIEIRGV